MQDSRIQFDALAEFLSNRMLQMAMNTSMRTKMGEQASARLDNGKLLSARVVDKIVGGIEKGELSQVKAIVLHQTGGNSAESALSSYKKGSEGAHFLIDSDGTIYQTARVDHKCWHVGKIQSRCYVLKTCEPDELKLIKGILFAHKEAYSIKVAKLHEHELGKDYPDRYPSNEDSIGIELVGGIDSDSGRYRPLKFEQTESLVWLVSTLQSQLKLTDQDVYRHPEVSYKQQSEAESAKWR